MASEKSRFRGVNKNGNRWRARFGSTSSSHDTQEDAAHAVDAARLAVGGRNAPGFNFDETGAESGDAAVVRVGIEGVKWDACSWRWAVRNDGRGVAGEGGHYYFRRQDALDARGAFLAARAAAKAAAGAAAGLAAAGHGAGGLAEPGRRQGGGAGGGGSRSSPSPSAAVAPAVKRRRRSTQEGAGGAGDTGGQGGGSEARGARGRRRVGVLTALTTLEL